MALSNNSNIMTNNKACTLVCFLLCLCFLSTSYAQPFFSATDVANDTHCQLVLEDASELDALLTNKSSIYTLEQPNLLIDHTLLQNLKRHNLPCCNRDPPRIYFI